MWAKIVEGVVVAFPYGPSELRLDNPETSFPREMDEVFLNSWDVYVVEETQPPTIDEVTQSIVQDTPVFEDGVWKQAWVVLPASAEEVSERLEQLQIQIANQVQYHLDTFARTRNYDNMLSLCTYATSTNPKFAAEGQYGVEARDATWAALYEMLAEVEAGERPIPSGFVDIEPELPALVWPN